MDGWSAERCALKHEPNPFAKAPLEFRIHGMDCADEVAILLANRLARLSGSLRFGASSWSVGSIWGKSGPPTSAHECGGGCQPRPRAPHLDASSIHWAADGDKTLSRGTATSAASSGNMTSTIGPLKNAAGGIWSDHSAPAA